MPVIRSVAATNGLTFDPTRTFRVGPVRISQLSRRSGVTVTALRFYESMGLIHAERSLNGYRDYDESVVERLSFIHAAKQLELSLPEIAELLDVVEVESCTRARDTLRPKLVRRLRDVDDRLATLQRLRERLVEATEQVIACPDSGRQCRTECALGDLMSTCDAVTTQACR